MGMLSAIKSVYYKALLPFRRRPEIKIYMDKFNLYIDVFTFKMLNSSTKLNKEPTRIR